MKVGDYVGFNLDIGHYVAGTGGKSPVPVIEKYHDKIISLHLKDRTADGGNLPWGQGQTPIKEVMCTKPLCVRAGTDRSTRPFLPLDIHF